MKIGRKTCIFDFISEIVFGIVFVILIIIYGKPVGILEGLPLGMGGGMIIYYFFRKRKLDERDYYLYYKVNHFTLAAVMGAVVISRLMIDLPRFTEFVNASWAQLVILSFFFFHGLFGLILFLRK
ncbi:MAG: hypothetical protein P9L97_07205 [Candidatus Tenebribacter davisii]|jgi:hypothetical protein|nr:hypothetical protein [Candidatus Tenebribacter davisii]